MESVSNYPMLTEGYKVATLDAMNKLRAVDRGAWSDTRRRGGRRKAA